MKPYYQRAGITIYHGDYRGVFPSIGSVQVVIADPPYGETSLQWDKQIEGWTRGCRAIAESLWCFGSLRMFMEMARRDEFFGWKRSQEIIWEKHNGSNFHADRFRRVHEIAAHFYTGTWRHIYKSPVTTPDATARTIRRKKRPTHTGHIDAGSYVSVDGGPRLARSVMYVRSCHGEALHPTQKPVGIIEPLILYSCPPGGRVCDPFMGSGSTLIAANTLGRKAVGIEIQERYCEIAAKRLNEAPRSLLEEKGYQPPERFATASTQSKR